MTADGAAAAFRPRVFIVEDEYYLADDLAQEFAAAGAHIVAFAPSIEKARGVLDRLEAIDVAVLDVKLLDADVFEVADLLRARGACIVFYSAIHPEELPERFRDCPLVLKPAGADRVYQEALRACG